jgi:hypothetical protein
VEVGEKMVERGEGLGMQIVGRLNGKACGDGLVVEIQGVIEGGRIELEQKELEME